MHRTKFKNIKGIFFSTISLFIWFWSIFRISYEPQLLLYKYKVKTYIKVFNHRVFTTQI